MAGKELDPKGARMQAMDLVQWYPDHDRFKSFQKQFLSPQFRENKSFKLQLW